MISKKHKKVSTIVNYIEHFLILASTVTGVFQFLFFFSLHGVSVRIMSSAIGLKICAITAQIKNYKSIIKKKKKENMIK